MNTTRLLCLSLALTLAACGGGKDEPRTNQAAGATFTYGASQPASAEQTGAMGGTVASLDALGSAPGAAAALGASDTSTPAAALLGSSPVGSTSPPTSGGVTFDVPACVTVTPTSVSFAGCRITIAQSGGGTSVAGTVTVGGTAGHASGGPVTWDLTVGIDATITAQQTIAMSVRSHKAGSVEVAATTAKGGATGEYSVSATVSGQSLAGEFDESLAFDLTHSPTCATRVTGGTLEAKRVWVTRPSGVSPAQLPDEALKVTWTGCGVATVQIGVR